MKNYIIFKRIENHVVYLSNVKHVEWTDNFQDAIKLTPSHAIALKHKIQQDYYSPCVVIGYERILEK
jgi:hypothetical protein